MLGFLQAGNLLLEVDAWIFLNTELNLNINL